MEVDVFEADALAVDAFDVEAIRWLNSGMVPTARAASGTYGTLDATHEVLRIFQKGRNDSDTEDCVRGSLSDRATDE